LPADASRQLRALTEWLRDQQQRRGLSYERLSARTDQGAGRQFSESTFSRAASGCRVPREDVVEAFARACGADTARAHELWRRAARAAARACTPAPPRKRQPETVATVRDFAAGLEYLRAEAGQPSLRALDRRAQQYGRRLPPGTLAAVLRGDQFPGKKVVEAFLDACGVSAAMKSRWLAARQSVIVGNERLAAREEARSRPAPVYLCEFAERAGEHFQRAEEVLAAVGRGAHSRDDDAWAIAQSNDKAANDW
jgi:transcriptional regulator with XRE-family HTH domain